MAIANAAETLELSILQLNKHPFRLTKTLFQSRTVHSRSRYAAAKKTTNNEQTNRK